MNRAIPSIRQHLLRIHLVIALIAVVLIFMVILVSDWRTTRRMLIDNFQESMQAASQGAAVYVGLKDINSLKIHLNDFQGVPGLRNLCVYDAGNTLIYGWVASEREESCPRLILRGGTQEDGLEVDSAIPLMKGKNYIGMFYASSSVVFWDELIVNNGIILIVLLAVAYFACRASSRFGARAITDSLMALQQQIECLHGRDYESCALLPPMTTRETASLAQSITAFRTHLSSTTLTRTEFKQARQWYCTLFAGWIGVLRQQLQADSPLLHQLSYYELLLHIEQGNPLPASEQFDLAVVLKSSIAFVHESYPTQDAVHLSATLQSTQQQVWRGYPELLQILFEHLMILGISRTPAGAVCLRLEVQGAEQGMPQLHIKFEDGGPPLQGGQLRQWLATGQEDVPSLEMAQHTSWLLVGRLFHYLKGEVHAQTMPKGGLDLEGMVPLMVPGSKQLSIPHAPAFVAPATLPLILVVEADKVKAARLEHLFLQAGCRIFLVEDHAQAMEWAPTLPLSAILLNGYLADAGAPIVRRLKHLAEEGLMVPVPLWAMGVAKASGEQQQWRDAGTVAFVEVPVSPKQLAMLCHQLPSSTADFYHAYDEQLHAELPTKILTRLDELNAEIARQIDQLEIMLQAMANGQKQPALGEQAHAVKSAALSLGYFRLAALMAQIEHALAHKQFLHARMHWSIIGDSLRKSNFMAQ